MPWAISKSPWYTMEVSRSQPAWGLGETSSQEDMLPDFPPETHLPPIYVLSPLGHTLPLTLRSAVLSPARHPCTAHFGGPGSRVEIMLGLWLCHSWACCRTPGKTMGQRSSHKKTHLVSEVPQCGFQILFTNPKEILP